jgi:hypothetical protein
MPWQETHSAAIAVEAEGDVTVTVTIRGELGHRPRYQVHH